MKALDSGVGKSHFVREKDQLESDETNRQMRVAG